MAGFIKKKTRWNKPCMACSTCPVFLLFGLLMFRSILIPHINVVRQYFKKVRLQHFGYFSEHSGINAVAPYSPIYGRAVAAKLPGKPPGRVPLPVEFFLYDLAYVYHSVLVFFGWRIIFRVSPAPLETDTHADRQPLASHEILQV